MKILNDAFCLRLFIAAGYLFLIVFIAYFWFSLADRDETILRLDRRIIYLEGQIESDRLLQESRMRDMALDELFKRLNGEADHESR